MHPSATSETPEKQLPLRALIKIVGAEIQIFPIAESETDERRILDALRFVRQDTD